MLVGINRAKWLRFDKKKKLFFLHLGVDFWVNLWYHIFIVSEGKALRKEREIMRQLEMNFKRPSLVERLKGGEIVDGQTWTFRFKSDTSSKGTFWHFKGDQTGQWMLVNW